jgi:ribulose-phosphate 3-epimerase
LTERTVKISPSLLSADFSRLREQIAVVEDAGAELLHVDVMDGHFVPNLTMGPVIVKAIKRAARAPLDVHLMIEEPARYAEAFAKAGSDLLTYHVECREGSPATAERIRDLGMIPGVAIRPDTPLSSVRDHLPLVDMVLVMSVMPGFSGQSFMAEVLGKTRALREELGYEGDIQMDGGIDVETIGSCAEAGANVFVAGSAIYGAEDPGERVRTLRGIAEGRTSIHR